jgi:hypothetical protein
MFAGGFPSELKRIRLGQIRRNHGGDHRLALSGFEIFGTMMECRLEPI